MGVFSRSRVAPTSQGPRSSWHHPAGNRPRSVAVSLAAPNEDDVRRLCLQGRPGLVGPPARPRGADLPPAHAGRASWFAQEVSVGPLPLSLRNRPRFNPRVLGFLGQNKTALGEVRGAQFWVFFGLESRENTDFIF